jgi:uncharacterized protein YbjT (DUF2867 family)
MLSSMVPYSKMKIGVEDTIKSLEFEQAIILRPGLILGDREVPKTAGLNRVVYALGHIRQGFQDSIGQEAEVIGRAAANATLLAKDGKAPSKFWVLEQADIVRLGRDEWKTEPEAAASA